MPRQVSLARISLSYADGMVLQTASSGAVPMLDELRLVVERDGAMEAVGATRLNIEYLTGIPPDTLLATCLEVFDALDWGGDWADLPARLPPDLPAPARMLFEMAMADGAARAAGLPSAAWLGGVPAERLPTNQTLFLSGDDTMLRRAQAYVARGFCDLKLRVGAGDVSADLRRIRLLRAAFGNAVLLSADVNGQWTEAEAPGHLAAFAALGLRYVEQPIPAGDWDATTRVSRAAALPIMLDESLSDMAAVQTLLQTRAAPMAHLKLAKLGGLDRLMAAGRALRGAGIPVMVGQMNEGAVSTLAAAHAAAALGAECHELYGADGLRSDPAGGLRYAEGCIHLLPGPGLGLLRHGPSPTLRERSA